MSRFASLAGLLLLLANVHCVHSHREGDAHIHEFGQLPLVDVDDFAKSRSSGSQTWLEKYGPQIDQGFSGPLSFAHLPYTRCLEDENAEFDIALLGMPFDTAVTYRPGARFGPYAIRSGSRRQRDTRGYTLAWKVNPYELGSKIIDCGDVPVNPFDNALAVDQMEVAYSTLLARAPANEDTKSVSSEVTQKFAKDGKKHPRIVSLGGDHTIVLPILRSLYKVYGPVSVIHFDAHLDTWTSYPGPSSEQSRVTHGTFFHLAKEEGLMTNTSIHAGIRTKLAGPSDIENDENVGFQLISTDDIDDYGVTEIIKRIRARVGNSPVYLSLDIDVIDPGLAPATGTPEAGGWTTREVKRIIRGLAGLNFVGADIVEVSPAYDNAEITGIAAADIVHDFLSMLLSTEPPTPHNTWPKPAKHRKEL
ncbi:Arginase/deacetylase [Lentinus tigrinus ALCF2SS1-6]|uniref:Arginase/deacetylase n=1 Tax=Lentinus tigrinus ALCF2SS1-6 TaxID=1328759 RepID=A0A5C2RXZ7_9APHY|nr:Arginase/deacetylase [Lentinus tigrinus ALCF2SS1-6]